MAKSDLQERLWPATFVVEKNLANLIGEIRTALATTHRTRDSSGPSTGLATRFVTRAAMKPTLVQPRRRIFVRCEMGNGRVRLDDGAHVLGRDPDVEILLDSPGVSRRHAVITIANGSATIEDLGSKNGTFVGNNE